VATWFLWDLLCTKKGTTVKIGTAIHNIPLTLGQLSSEAAEIRLPHSHAASSTGKWHYKPAR